MACTQIVLSFYFFLFFFSCSKCKLLPATLQDFSPLMIWREISTHSADRGKSTRISNTSDTEWYTATGSKLNKDSYPKTLVSLSALLPLSLRPQIWEKVSRSAVTILKICISKKSPVNYQRFSSWILFLMWSHLGASIWLDQCNRARVNIKAYTDEDIFWEGRSNVWQKHQVF